MRIAVHLHLHYLDQLDYFIGQLANLGGIPFDLFVTLTVENEDVVQKVRAFKPDARIWVVENRGYDVGPFIDFLNQIDLDAYDYILKLHTKGTSWAKNTKLNGYYVSNTDWARLLVEALLKSPEMVYANLNLLATHPHVTLLGSKTCICNQALHYEKLLPQINGVLSRLQLAPVSRCEFLGGTMFMARAGIFKPLQNKFGLSDFEPTNGLVKEGLLAHVMERVFGILATQNRGCIQGVGDETWLAIKGVFNAILRFFYQNKKTESKHIIKVLKISIYRKKFA